MFILLYNFVRYVFLRPCKGGAEDLFGQKLAFFRAGFSFSGQNLWRVE